MELTMHEDRMAESALVMLWQARTNMRSFQQHMNNRIYDMVSTDADIATPEGVAMSAMVGSLKDWIDRIDAIREEYQNALRNWV